MFFQNQEDSPVSPTTAAKSFKEKKSFASRKRDADSVKDLHPDKLPLIIERYKHEKALPMLDKIKFLVPFDMTVGTLTSIIRKRLQLNSSQALFILFDNKNIFSASGALLDIYRDQKDEDGFLYIIYASQETFG
ncbi:microtubule-associated proteins 1A/1B light chain 3A-like [Clytia hemisphaerica]|uniref:Uncharacterized protein n=1 Tax=Clytia hemisphaerica TaxID=252671 RepID=A0A7M5TX05_9CNID|eukprot:TCONS_00006692-protein